MPKVVAAAVRGPRKYFALVALLALVVVWWNSRHAQAAISTSSFRPDVSESSESPSACLAKPAVDGDTLSDRSKRRQFGERLRALIERRCAKLARDVELARGLEFLRPVHVRICERAATVADGGSLIGPWAAVILRSLAGEQGRGQGEGARFFYGGADTIWLRSDSLGHLTDEVLVHEMVHALDDQHYQMVEELRRVATTDARIAITAAIEGSAVESTNRYLARVGTEAARARVVPDVCAAHGDADAPRTSTSLAASSFAQYMRRFLYGNGLEWVDRAHESMRLAPRSTRCLLDAEVGSDFAASMGLGAESRSCSDSLGLALTLYLAAAAARSGDRHLARVFGADPDGPIRPNRGVSRLAEDFQGDLCRPGARDCAGEDALVVWTTQWRTHSAARRFAQILAPDPDERSRWSIRIECMEQLVTVLIQARNAPPANGSRG